MEKAYALGDHIDPDNPRNKRLATGAVIKPVAKCQKELAFGLYCLGSNIKTLLDQRTPLRQHAKDNLYIFDFRERRGLTTITTFQGKILSVKQTDRPANWPTTITVRQRIEALYGKADDQSTFTENLNTTRRIEFAVYKKKAKAHYVWLMSGWRIDVIWDNIRNINITFIDEDLNKRYLTSQKQHQTSSPQG